MQARSLKKATSGLALAAGLWSASALAQTAGSVATAVAEPIAAEPADEGDIVVTARRFNERLQQVPAAITVFSAEALEAARVRTSEDFTQLTSGVSIITGAINAGDVQVNIRGINGARDAPGNVALVVDGVQKSSTAALVQNQGVLESVEILKGPQGALYGRNSIAGAFVITTKKPGDKLEGTLTASAGNNESYRIYGQLSAPLSETFGTLIAGDWSRTDGFFRNSFLPTDLNQQVYPGNSSKAASVDSNDQWNVYGRALWTPTDSTEFDFKVRYGQYNGSAINFNAVFQLPGLVAATGNPLFNEDINDHEYIYTANNDPVNTQSNLELSLRASHSLDFGILTGWVAYNDFKNNQSSDSPSGSAFGYFAAEPRCVATLAALNGFPVQAPFGIGGAALLPPYSPTTCDGVLYEQHDQRDISAELRLASQPGGPLQWQLGGYYLYIDRRDCLATQLDVGLGYDRRCFSTNPNSRTEGLQDDNATTNVYAGFGSVDYSPLEGLKFGLALRYDREDRKSRSLVAADARTLWVGNVLTGFPNGTPGRPANYFLNPGLDPAYNSTGRLDPRQQSFEQWQPKITIAYQAAPDLNLFANWGIGFKSGGFNPAGTTAIVNGFFNSTFNAGVLVRDDFAKETSSAYEVGAKGRLFDRRLSWEASVYYTEVTDAQVFEFFVGPFGQLRVVENIDRVEILGIEGSLNYRLVSGWTIFASANYTDSKIKENATRPYTVGNRSPDTALFTVNAGTQVNAEIGRDLTLNGRFEGRLTGPTWFSAVQQNSVPNIFPFGPGNFSNTQRDTYLVLNGQVGLQRGRFGINVYASNLLNEKFLGEAIVTPEFGAAFGSPGDRRSFGIEGVFKF